MNSNNQSNKIYGYCRISTAKQSIDRQNRNISAAYPNAHIFQEAYTGKRISGRREFEKMTKVVREGDTIVFDSVSRMSRNAEEGIEQYMKWFNAGINLCFLKEPQINTETYKQDMETEIAAVSTGDKDTDELVNTVFKAISQYMKRLATKQIRLAFEQAQKECDDLRQRTKEGLITAKAAGKQIGLEKGKTLTTRKSVAAKETIKKHSKDFFGTLDDTECIKLAGISRNSYYKYKRELAAEINS